MAGAIKGITIEFRGETTQLDKALREIDRNTRSIDSELKKVNQDLKFNPKNVELWRQKQSLLKDKISETEDRLKTLKAAQDKMDAEGVDKNSREYQKLRREIIETESKLKTFNAQAKNLKYPGLSAMSEKLKEVGGRLTKVGEGMKKAGKGLSKYVTAPLAGIGAIGVKSFAEVDKTMTLTNQTMRNTTKEAALLDSAMKEAAANSTYGMNDAATASLNFARAGLSAEQAASALAPAMNLAAGEGGNLDTVSAGLVATINGFQDGFERAGEYADVFANACNSSALDVDSLSSAMSVAAPIFSAAGYSVNDAALYMGVMANNGIEADKAANSLKTGLARLVSPAKQGAAMMESLGIEVTKTDGSMKDSVTIQKELHDTFARLSESEQIAAASAIFGKNQMAPWLALINTAPADVNELNAALSITGTTGEMASAMMGGFGGSIERLKSGIDVLTTSIGQALAPVLQKVIDFVQRIVDWFNQLDPETQSLIATVGMVVAAIGPILVILGTLASSIGSIMTLVGTLSPVIGGAVSAALPVVGVVAGIIAAGVLLYKNWDTIKAKATQIWNAIKTTVGGVVDNVKAKFEALKTSLSNIWDGIKAKAKAVFDGIKQAITHPIQTARDLIQKAIDKIKSIFSGLKLQLPKFKLPHFNIKGGKIPWGLGGKGEKPSISVDWYKTGGIFTNPRIVGIGEAGPEAVVPLDVLWDKMDRIADAAGGSVPLGGVTINIYAQPGMNIQQLAEEIERRLVRAQKQRAAAWQ